MFSELWFFKFKKFVTRSGFGGTPTNRDIIEFQNFSLQLKNQMSGSKTVPSVSIILILKWIMTF